MATDDTRVKPPRNVCAIITSVISFAVLRLIYGAGLAYFVVWIASYDRGIGTGFFSWAVATFVPSLLAGLGAMVVATKVFRRSDIKLVFYSFCSIAITFTVIGSVLSILTKPIAVIAIVIDALAIVFGAWIGRLYAEAHRQQVTT